MIPRIEATAAATGWEESRIPRARLQSQDGGPVDGDAHRLAGRERAGAVDATHSSQLHRSAKRDAAAARQRRRRPLGLSTGQAPGPQPDPPTRPRKRLTGPRPTVANRSRTLPTSSSRRARAASRPPLPATGAYLHFPTPTDEPARPWRTTVRAVPSWSISNAEVDRWASRRQAMTSARTTSSLAVRPGRSP